MTLAWNNINEKESALEDVNYSELYKKEITDVTVNRGRYCSLVSVIYLVFSILADITVFFTPSLVLWKVAALIPFIVFFLFTVYRRKMHKEILVMYAVSLFTFNTTFLVVIFIRLRSYVYLNSENGAKFTFIMIVVLLTYFFAAGIRKYLVFIIGIPYIIAYFYLDFSNMLSYSDKLEFMYILGMAATCIIISVYSEKRHFQEFKLSKDLEYKTRVLKKMSETDWLTGMYNHRTIIEKVNQEVKRAKRYKSLLSIMMLDIDYFKSINDKYGHLAGDKVLREVGKIITSDVRDTDLAGRYGGEEFLVIFPSCTKEAAMEGAERIRKSIEKMGLLSSMSITASGGLVQYNGEDAEEFVRRADRAMYTAKSAGRNNIYASNGG